MGWERLKVERSAQVSVLMRHYQNNLNKQKYGYTVRSMILRGKNLSWYVQNREIRYFPR